MSWRIVSYRYWLKSHSRHRPVQQPTQQNPRPPVNPVPSMALCPFSPIDGAKGNKFSVPLNANTYWVYPEGTMIQDLENQMEFLTNQLIERRSGVTLARPTPAAPLNIRRGN